MSSTEHLVDRLRSGSINRRHLVGGAAGVATAATAAVALGSYVSAQSSSSATATPETESGTSETTTTTGSAQDAKVITDRSAAIIASVKADRDALASSIDTAPIDELLSLAADLQTKAEAASIGTGPGRRSSKASSGSTSSSATSSSTPAASSSSSSTSSTETTTPGKLELAFAAAHTAQAARATIVAQLAKFGLPSQQARLSRSLAAVYDAVKSIGTTAGTAGEADASTLVSHAEAAYKSAYDAYNAKTYASATAYGEAAARLGRAAAMLLGLREGKGMGGMLGDLEMPGRGTRGGGGPMNGDWGGNQEQGGKNNESDSETNDDTSATPSASTSSDSSAPASTEDPTTPVDVPAPSF
ncbi:MAG: hypothetical protein WBA46_12175 [Thermomicrobiales bacterium]